MVQIMNETANTWQYKVGIKVIIANFECLWKCRMLVITVNWLRQNKRISFTQVNDLTQFAVK